MRQFQEFLSLQNVRPDFTVRRNFYAILAFQLCQLFQKVNKIQQIQTYWPSKPLQSLKCYKHQIIAAIKFIPAIKAITSTATIEATYNEYLDNVLSKSAKLYKVADWVYGIGGYPHSVKRCL